MTPDRWENDEALARRLRRLPPPAIPAGLEERLLAGVPPKRRARRLRSWLAAAVLLSAAACLLLALRLPTGVGPHSVKRDAVVPAPAGGPTLWAYEQALRQPDADASAVLDRAGPGFTWPVAAAPTAFRSGRTSRLLD